MKWIFPRRIALAVCAAIAFAVCARADNDAPAGDEESQLKLADHAIDAKVQEIIKNSKNTGDAINTLRQMVIQNPKNAELWYQIGEVCFAANDMEKALSAYKKCVALDPRRKGVWGTIGMLEYLGRDPKDAVQALKTALEVDPGDVDAMNTMAIILVETGKLDAAKDLLDQIKAIAPKYPKAWATAGQLFSKRMQYQDALDAYGNAVELDPKDFRAVFNHGFVHMDMNDHAAAIADFQKVTQMAPDYVRGWVALFQAYAKDNQPGEAVKAAKAAVAQHPKNAVFLQLLGEACIAAKDQANAIEALKQAKELAPDARGLETDFAAATALGNGNGRDDGASEEELKKAIISDPKDAASLTALGRLYMKEWRGREAAACFEKAAALQPDNAEIRRYLGEAYFALNQDDLAQAALDKADALGENSSGFWYVRGLLYEREKKMKESLAAYETAAQISPSNALYLAHAADMRRVNGKLDEALQGAQDAVHLAPENPLCYLVLGSVYQAQNKIPEANAAFEKALALNPGTTDVNVYARLGIAALSSKPVTSEKIVRAEELLEKAAKLQPENVMILRPLGMAYMAHRKFADAARVYGDAEKIAPGNAVDSRAYAEALILSGQFDQAEPVLNGLIATQSGEVAFWGLFYKLYKARGKGAEAVPFFQKQLEKQPGNVALLTALGDTQMALKDFKAAAATLKKASGLKKDDPVILGDYAQTLAAMGDPAGIEPARRAYELSPTDPPTMLPAANALLRLGKLQEAEDILVKLVAITPDSQPAWELLMACYEKEYKMEDVARCRKKLADLGLTVSNVELAPPPGGAASPVKIPPPDESMAAYKKLQADPNAGEDAWFHTGMDLYNNKQYPEAVAAFRKLTELSPDKPRGWSLLGFTFWARGMFADAVPAFQKALDKDASDAMALRGMAYSQATLQHFPEAGDAAAKYVAIDPNDKQSWSILVDSCIFGKKWEDADARAREAIALHPTWVEMWLADAVALKNMGRPAMALSVLEKATELDPQYARARIALGQLYGESGQLDKSIEQFRRATEIDPASADAWNNLGYSTFLAGHVPEAIGFYQKSIDCDAKFSTAWINLARAYAKQGDAAKTAETCAKLDQLNPALAQQLRAELNVK